MGVDCTSTFATSPHSSVDPLTLVIVATRTHSSNGPSDVRGPLLHTTIVATDHWTSEAHSYCKGTRHERGCY
jgi:hypothetical protein